MHHRRHRIAHFFKTFHVWLHLTIPLNQHDDDDDNIKIQEWLSVKMCIVAFRVGLGVESCIIVFLADSFTTHVFGHFCTDVSLGFSHKRRKSWQDQKQTLVQNCKYVSTDADYGYSRQRSAAVPYHTRSTIGYHGNSWASSTWLTVCIMLPSTK